LQETQEAEVQNLESFDLKSDKELLLDEYEHEEKRSKNITFRELLYIYLALFVILAIILPKIYISNQIYYLSKDINSMYHKYTALKEEREALKRELENIRYKINVIDELNEEKLQQSKSEED
jgi:cell division protein FtsB